MRHPCIDRAEHHDRQHHPDGLREDWHYRLLIDENRVIYKGSYAACQIAMSAVITEPSMRIVNACGQLAISNGQYVKGCAGMAVRARGTKA